MDHRTCVVGYLTFVGRRVGATSCVEVDIDLVAENDAFAIGGSTLQATKRAKDLSRAPRVARGTRPLAWACPFGHGSCATRDRGCWEPQAGSACRTPSGRVSRASRWLDASGSR